MATFELRSGAVPAATTSLPRLSERFGLPDPFRERYADDFETAGALNGSAVQVGSPARTWSVPSGGITKASGRITPDTSASGVGRVGRFDAGLVDYEALTVIRLGGASDTAGLLVRTQDATNTFRVAAGTTVFVIQLYVANAISGTSASVAVSLSTGVDYGLYARCEGNVFTARLVNLTTFDIIASLTRTDATFNTATGVGVSLAGATPSIADFHLSALTG